MKYLRQFNNHEGYASFTATTGFIKPNVSICVINGHTHFNPIKCEESTEYELIGEPSYPSTVEGDESSFEISFNYKRVDINKKCQRKTSTGSDTVVVEIGQNPSTTSSRTVSGVYDYNGLEIPYSVEQTKMEYKVIGVFNVTDTSSQTTIAYHTTRFTKIEIDGVEQPSTTKWYTFTTTGEHTVIYTLNGKVIDYQTFYDCTSLTSIDIPSGITTIGTSAFQGCTSLSSCTIGNGLTSIEQSAFNGCTSLTSIDIPDSVTSISTDVFNNCISLTSISIPDGVTSIGEATFQNCSAMTSCTIGSSITEIGNSAFTRCYGLTNIIIPNSVTRLRRGCFYGCSGLTSCTIGSGVTNIGESAFTYCSKLIKLNSDTEGVFNIPDNITDIDSYAFYGCSGMTTCTIGSSMANIYNYVFTDCTRLTNIVSNAITAPSTTFRTFYDIARNGRLYVPIGSSGYNEWMSTSQNYLGYYNWTKIEQ